MEEDGSIPFVRWPSIVDGHPQFESASSVVENRDNAQVADVVLAPS